MAIVKPIIRKGSGGVAIGDATAAQWDIKNGSTAYIAGGKVTGSGYFPAMMEYDGSTGYYSKAATVSVSGDLVSGIARFKIPTFAGAAANQRILNIANGTGSRFLLVVYSSDYSTTTRRNKLSLICQNSAGSVICRVFSTSDVNDDAVHTVLATFNGSTGAATIRIDGADELDTGNAEHSLATGTLINATCAAAVGADTGGSNKVSGAIGFVGYDDQILTWSDFMRSDGSPKELDTSTWTEWGGTQPAFFHESAKMDENKGSAGAMTKNGTITLAAASSWS